MSDEVVNSFLGRQLGPCELLDVVGSGTYGTVFRARDTTQANVWRAVKVLVGPVADVTAFKFRLPQEIRRAITLSHPHVVPVYRFGSEEGLQYVVMEFVESVSLAGLLRQAPVETRHADPTIHQCLRQVAAALDYAHAQRVVHADVNPANILLRRPDRHALVTDFCIGRAVPLDRLAELGIAFDCAYRSPEQCAPSPSDLTAAADVYALAAVLWHVVTGAPPFGTGMEARARHVSEPLPELSRAGAQLPSGLQEVLARGLAKPPGDRHQRASQLVREFISAAAGRAPVPTRPQPPAPAPAPVVAPPVPVAPAPVPSGPAISAPPAPPPAERPVYVFDPTRELRESPLWRPHPSAAAAEPPQPAWRLPLWLIALIAASLVVVTVAAALTLRPAGSGPSTAARSSSVPPTALPSVAPTAPPSVAPTPSRGGLPAPVRGSVGRAVAVAGMRLTLISTAASILGTTLPVRRGERYVAVEVLYENSGKPAVIVNPYDWALTDDLGRIYGADSPGLPNDLPQRQLPGGGEVRGLVAFSVPEQATGLVLHFSAERGDEAAVFPLA